MKTIKFKKMHEDAVVPFKKHHNDAGFDLCAIEDIIIPPGETKVIKLGIGFDIPKGHMLQLCARSSISKKGLIISNGVGIIDEGYKGEVAIALHNPLHSALTQDFLDNGAAVVKKVVNLESGKLVRKGERIAQVVLVPVVYPELEEVHELEESERGTGGFGSTGEK